MASSAFKYSLSAKPEVDQFVEILVTETRWYDLGTFLKAPRHELDHINVTYHIHGVMRCQIELHKCLHQRDILPTWQDIAEALRKMGNYTLANTISPTGNITRESQTQQRMGLATRCMTFHFPVEFTVVVKTEVDETKYFCSDSMSGSIRPNKRCSDGQYEETPPTRKLTNAPTPPTYVLPSSQVEHCLDTDSQRFCKLLHDSLRFHHKDICTCLNKSDPTLINFTMSLYSGQVIDEHSRISVIRKKGLEGADELMTYVRSHLESGEGDMGRYRTIMRCMEDEAILRDVLEEIRKFKGQ